MCQTDNYVSFSDSSSQTARLSENDRDAVIKEFYLSMGFSLRHDFEVENIRVGNIPYGEHEGLKDVVWRLLCDGEVGIIEEHSSEIRV